MPMQLPVSTGVHRNTGSRAGGSFDVQECTTAQDDEAGGIIATGQTDFCSKIEFEVENEDDENVGQFECGYDFICGDEAGDEAPLFLLDSEKDISEVEFEACIRQVELISEKLFHVECIDTD